jgi:hypothetical protein
VVVDRAVYGTITIMSVLIVYDGWQNLHLRDVLGVIIGPVIAMFVAHVFSAAIALQVEVGRTLTNDERLGLVRSESHFLLLAVPPAVIATVLSVAGMSLSNGIRVVLLFGVASLGFWGGLAGQRAGLTGRRLLVAIAAGLVVGAAILAMQVFLQPGKAVYNGVV